MMIVVSVINSDIGRVGTIGFRFQKLKNRLDEVGVENVTIARSNPVSVRGVVHMGPLSILMRILHYLRRNYFPGLNSKRIDLAFFGVFVFVALLPIVLINIKKQGKVAYFLEPFPFAARVLRRCGFQVVYDLPIAPNSYVKRVLQEYPDCGLYYHKSIDRIERNMLNISSIIIAPSEFVSKELRAIGVSEKSIRVIPFGTDIGVFDEKQEAAGGIRFVFAGIVGDRKGIGYLLRAWQSGGFEADQLHLCGSVTEKYRKLIGEMECNNIYTPGFVDVREYFSGCDVYIFPSLMEGSSKSIYDAMACRLPAIVTKESGSIISNAVDGLVIDAFSPEQIESAMQSIKNMDYVEMGLAASRNVKMYSWDRYAESVEKVVYEIAR